MIGIYGGTFDPVHFGHLRTALEVSEALELEELRFLPCQIPAHRGTPGGTPVQRRQMLQAALANAPAHVVIDSRELERPGVSYMVDTLATIRAEIGPEPLGLIVGQDAFRNLPGWHRWTAIPELAHIIVMQRPNSQPDYPPELQTLLATRQTTDVQALKTTPAGLIQCLPVTQLDISASQIRHAITTGHNPRYLTPDAVLDLIRDYHLYAGG